MFKTTLFQQLPWIGGLNTSVDESMVPPNQLTIADNLIFDTRGSRRKRDGIKNNWDSVAIASVSVANPTVITTSTAHGLTTGDTVVISGTSTTATTVGSFVATVTAATTFTIPVNVSAVVTGTGTLYSNNTSLIIGLHDYWFGTTSKTQRIIGVGANKKFYSYNSGTRTALTDAGTAYGSDINNCSMTTYNNLCIIAVPGTGNVVKKYAGTGDVENLNGTPPVASICGEHLGRLLLNDKTNIDRLHYSPTFDHTQWNGAGDSGAIDIGTGDGDSEGITAFVSFKGSLFVFKRTKTYRITGTTPETFQVELISSGVGCVSQNSIAYIDQDDVFFASERGIHSLATTDAYGDFENTFVSADIQKTYRDDLSRARLKYIKAGYLSNINSYAFSATSSSGTSNDDVYLYNIPLKAWYKWTSISSESLIVAGDSDKKRFYFGRSDTRVSKSFNGTNYDISTAGTNTAISFRVKTGIIFPDQNPYGYKGFKRFILYYRPVGTHQVSVNVKIDNHVVSSENQLDFSEVSSSSLLGDTFILGTSTLGYMAVLGPFSRSIDGHGRGFQIDITQSGIDQSAEIQGIGVEYEGEGVSAESTL